MSRGVGGQSSHVENHPRRRTLSESSSHPQLERVLFNVGNRQFDVPVDLLEKEACGSRLHNFLKQASIPCAIHVETDVFRNRDPELFQRVLHFLETNQVTPFGVEEYKNLIEEARFYELPDLQDFLHRQVFQSFGMDRPLSRRDKRRPESGRGSASNKIRHSRNDSEAFSDNVFEEDRSETGRRPFTENNRNRNYYSYKTGDFGLADLLNDAPLRRASYDRQGESSDGYQSLDEDADNLKLGREYYLYKKALMKNPNANPPKLEENKYAQVIRPPNVNTNGEFQYRPSQGSRKEPEIYRIEEPKFSQFKVKAWIQDTGCNCKKRGLERYVQNYLKNEVETSQWKDLEVKRTEDKWRTVIRDWFRVYNVSCEHRMSSCTLDIEFTNSVDKLSQKKLKAYLQSFGKLNHVIFEYSIEGKY